ncbi:MAG: NAD(P)H-hydrate epimerase [Phycisphaerae bacterium]|nr:NAD(P)H-hydrate epimerase [Phycisphaerae bacterium]
MISDDFMAVEQNTHSLTRDEVRAVDRHAIEVLGVPGVVLMENAGRNAAAVVENFLNHDPNKGVAVVSGAGNNGGDGYVIARHLARCGYPVVTFLLAPEDKITGDARINLDILHRLGLEVRPVEDPSRLAEELREFDLIVDAAGGTGVRGAPRGDLAEAVEQINAAGKPVVAIDIPTGLDCDTGQAPGPCIRAAVTVTFVARKRGFDNPASLPYTGEVIVADIGIDPQHATPPTQQNKTKENTNDANKDECRK